MTSHAPHPQAAADAADRPEGSTPTVPLIPLGERAAVCVDGVCRMPQGPVD